MNRRPAAFLFLSALLGAFFGCELRPSLGLILSIGLSLVVLNIVRHQVVKIVCFLLFTGLTTALVSAIEKDQYSNTIALMPHEETIFTGKVLTSAKKEDGSTVAVVRAHSVNDAKKTLFDLRIRLIESIASTPLPEGSLVRFKGQPQPFDAPLSPTDFDGFRFGLAHHLHGSITLRDNISLFVGEKISTSIFSNLRHRLFERMLSYLPVREASLLLALMIGDTNLLSDEQIDIFRKIGAQHLLAVSGLQVTILAAICFLVFMPLFGLLLPRRLSHRAQASAAAVTIVMSFCFIGLSGFPSSAVRAFLMASFMLLNSFISRKIDVLDSFFASGLISILLAPLCVLDLGYLLSYAAVFGLLVAHKRSQALRAHLQDISRVLAWTSALLITSIAAFLATLPIIAFFIGAIAPLSIIANLLLVPVASTLQIPAIIFGFLGAIFNWPGLIRLAAYFSNIIEVMAQVLSDYLGHIIYLPSVDAVSLLMILTSSILVFLCLLKYSRLLLLSAVLLMVWPAISGLSPNRHLEVTVIPVGQGDASLFSLPTGHNILVDAGGQPHGRFDPGERKVVPTLKRKGIDQVDILVITHPDPDHILGAFAVLKELTVKEIWHSGFSEEHPLTRRMLKEASLQGITVKNAKDILGSHHFGATEIQVLAPDTKTDEIYFNELSSNNNSLVLRILHGDHALLWPGDIEDLGEQLLLSSNNDLTATILKAPHHGSKTSSSDNFIKEINPRHVIYSTGKNNRFKFPHHEVTDKFKALGVQEWNTATDGEITISLTEKTLSIHAFCSAGPLKKIPEHYYQH